MRAILNSRFASYTLRRESTTVIVEKRSIHRDITIKSIMFSTDVFLYYL
jgi:hypothetical protein